jgi:hypothetical protein
VDAALNVTQATDRLLQQNRHEPEEFGGAAIPSAYRGCYRRTQQVPTTGKSDPELTKLPGSRACGGAHQTHCEPVRQRSRLFHLGPPG